MLWTTEILKIVLPFLAAGVGAFAGGRVALARYKSERAHDKLIDWYERANHSLVVVLQLTHTMINELKETGGLDAELQADRNKLIGDLDVVIESGVLYARPSTLSRLYDAQRRGEALLREMEELGPDYPPEKVLVSFHEARRIVREAHLHLVSDGRDELLGKKGRLEHQQLVQLQKGTTTALEPK